MQKSLDLYRWLTSEHATDILTETERRLLASENMVRIATRLRKQIGVDQAAALIELARLRIKGTRKFGRAEQMFFTADGLQMATDERIAAYKSQRFEKFERVADLCCGIGGDLIWLGQLVGQGGLRGFDRDPLAVLYANANLAIYKLPPLARLQSTAEVDWSEYDAIHIDPQRRAKKKTTAGDQFSPTLREISEALDDRISAGIKVAPATGDTGHLHALIEREWIGHSRQCQQQMIWTGKLAHRPGHRRAVRIGKSGELTAFDFPAAQIDAANIGLAKRILRYLYEPHSVLLASGLAKPMACCLGLEILAPDIPYFTADRRLDNRLWARFALVCEMPANAKKVLHELTRLEVGRLEIKNRGVDENLSDRFRGLKTRGSNSAAVILAPIRNRPTAIIVKRETGG
jgi:hypothetical protein